MLSRATKNVKNVLTSDDFHALLMNLTEAVKCLTFLSTFGKFNIYSGGSVISSKGAIAPRLLSWSQVSEEHRCPWRRHQKYDLKLRPRIKRRSLSLGSAVHAGIAAAILSPQREIAIGAAVHDWTANQSKNLTDAELDYIDFGELTTTATGIAQRAVKFLDLDRWETISYNGQPLCEQRVVVPMPGWDGFVGVMDWVARDRLTGYVWLIDHKVRSKFMPDESEEVNAQMATYQHLLNVVGIEDIRGSICFQIRDQLPVTPSINRDGSISRMRVLTDWDTYLRAIRDAGQDPANYAEMMDKLEGVEFFRMTTSYRSHREVEAIWENVVVPTSEEILRQRTQYVRTLGTFNCNGCEFRQLCLEDLRGGDVEFIRQNDFEGPHSNAKTATRIVLLD